MGRGLDRLPFKYVVDPLHLRKTVHLRNYIINLISFEHFSHVNHYKFKTIHHAKNKTVGDVIFKQQQQAFYAIMYKNIRQYPVNSCVTSDICHKYVV